eukprot:gene7903-1115_t
MALNNTHRPAEEWLADLSKAKNSNHGMRPKVTLQDLQERINDPNSDETSLIPTSPRSVQACFNLGIDPIELQYHPASWYARPAEDEDLSKLRYELSEGVRQERMMALIDQRKNLVDSGWTDGPDGKSNMKKKSSEEEAQESSMVEQERMRLEALQRRQEKDLQQMVQFEISRKELADKQAQKMAELEKRSKALTRQKLESEVAWQARQRDIELQKAREEEELERQMKRLMEERHRREKERAAHEAEEEKRRKKEAYAREMERRHKSDQARLETEAILEAQAEEVRLRKADMERKDEERAKRLLEEQKHMALVNAEKKKKAEERIASALSVVEAKRQAMRQKEEANEQRKLKFEKQREFALCRSCNILFFSCFQVVEARRQAMRQKEVANEQRKMKLEKQRKRDEEAKRLSDIRKEQERLAKFQHAADLEEQRKQMIKQKAAAKDQALMELHLQRKKENAIKQVNTEFELKLRQDKVDSLQKQQLYERQRQLDKIMGEYESSRKLMMDRARLQDKRKMANMEASMRRQQLSSAMDHIKGKDIQMLASGQMSVNQLIKRPHTAS